MFKKRETFAREILASIVDSMEYILPANMEIVLHDLKKSKRGIIKIINGHVSGRNKNSSLLEVPDQDIGLLLLANGNNKKDNKGQCVSITGYETRTKHGKKLKSASTIYFDDNGDADTALCINVDLTVLEKLKSEISYLEPKKKKPDNLALSATSMKKDKIVELVDGVIEKYRDKGELCKKPLRFKIIRELNVLGVLNMRGAITIIAKKLSVSRYTIYNDIIELK